MCVQIFMQCFFCQQLQNKRNKVSKGNQTTNQTAKRSKDGNRRNVDFVLFSFHLRILTECAYKVIPHACFEQNGRRTNTRTEYKLNNWIYSAFCRRRCKRINTHTDSHAS